jgi:biopolymer transport protein ExbD
MVAPDARPEQGMALLRTIARVLPLRKPILGLPNFGILAGILSVFLVMAMMMIKALPGIMPKGLPVRLLRVTDLSRNRDQWTGPLVVLVNDASPGQTPKLYVNANPVAWEELDQVLKRELGRRRDWVVYVGGDEAVHWQDIANVIDVARGDQATVYLISAKSLHPL